LAAQFFCGFQPVLTLNSNFSLFSIFLGATCLQKNCGQQKHSVEARIKRAGLDYSSVRRWILANKRLILTDEVFRDARQEEKEKNDGNLAKKSAVSIDQVKEDIQKTQQQLGYTPPTAKEQAEQPVQPIDDAKANIPPASNANSSQNSASATNNNAQQPTAPAANNASATASAPSSAADAAPAKKPAAGLKVYVKSRQGQSWDPSKVNQDRPLACVPLRGHPGVHVYGVMDGNFSLFRTFLGPIPFYAPKLTFV
jgi:hypothetical protein